VPISLPSSIRLRRASSVSVSFGEVANRRHSGRKIKKAVVVSDVGVHIPEAGEQRFTGGVDHFRIGWPWFCQRANALNPVSSYYYVLVFKDLSVSELKTFA